MKPPKPGKMPKGMNPFAKAGRPKTPPGASPMGPPNLTKKMKAPAKTPQMLRKGGKVSKCR